MPSENWGNQKNWGKDHVDKKLKKEVKKEVKTKGEY